MLYSALKGFSRLCLIILTVKNDGNLGKWGISRSMLRVGETAWRIVLCGNGDLVCLDLDFFCCCCLREASNLDFQMQFLLIFKY